MFSFISFILNKKYISFNYIFMIICYNLLPVIRQLFNRFWVKLNKFWYEIFFSELSILVIMVWRNKDRKVIHIMLGRRPTLNEYTSKEESYKIMLVLSFHTFRSEEQKSQFNKFFINKLIYLMFTQNKHQMLTREILVMQVIKRKSYKCFARS